MGNRRRVGRCRGVELILLAQLALVGCTRETIAFDTDDSDAACDPTTGPDCDAACTLETEIDGRVECRRFERRSDE